MSLRDHFAAKALGAIITSAHYISRAMIEDGVNELPEYADLLLPSQIAIRAYIQADAMLAARDKQS